MFTQTIKAACEVESLGDVLSPQLLGAADDLYYQRIPSNWRLLAGETAPPPTQSLTTWLADLQNRAQHLEKILTQVCIQPSYHIGKGHVMQYRKILLKISGTFSLL